MTEHPPPHDAVEAAVPAGRQADRQDSCIRQRVVSSDSLLAGAMQLAILHHQTVYFLRQTRLGKLILTK
jgi:hemin uptake protein HemP